jgi:hypothetical protein
MVLRFATEGKATAAKREKVLKWVVGETGLPA